MSAAAQPDLSKLPDVLPANLPDVLPADGVPARKAAASPSTYEKLTRSYNPDVEEYAAKHPILGPLARFLDATGGAVISAPESAYNYAQKIGSGFVHAGLTGVANAVVQPIADAAEAYNPLNPNHITARGAISVLPEALGQATGNVAAGEAAGTAIPKLSKTAKFVSKSGTGVVSKLRQIRGTELSPEEAASVPPSGQVSPVLANTPREVLEHANDIGMTLTPGEATERALPRTIESEGERSMAVMNQLQKEATANRATLFQSVTDLADKLDPYKLGADDVTAGNAIKQSAKTALSVARENANAAYKQVGIDQEDMAGDISGLKKFAADQQFVRQPHAALTRQVYQPPAVKAALDDISDAPDRLGSSPSIQSLRNLRTEFHDKANDYSGNIPQAAQHMYSQAEQITDKAIMDAAKGTPLEDSFRDASAQWSALKQKYDAPDTILSTILKTDDPARITNAVLSRKSAADIELMRGEGMNGALEAIRRQVITRIARSNFAVSKGSLAGFPDTFLQSLFGPGDLKALALKADIARRIKFQMNPSGTGNVLLGASQIRHPIAEGIPLAVAGKMSKPRPPLSYLPKAVPLRNLNP